jgi:WD40 repeat protein
VAGYEVLGVLGRGGMGVVYRARQLGLGRIVALKRILHAEYAGPEARRRFQAEAESIARLQHPHIVQIHEVGEAGGLAFFSLEYCGGGSLEERLDGTPWEAPRAARLIETLAGAVAAAHAAGIIHRDLKPGNVLLSEDGTPKVADFGLAKRLDVPGQTQTGAVVGTPSYMAPEQAVGSKEVGPAADVYALGALLYELLTGRPPFKAATTLETLRLVLSEEAVAVRRLQPGVPRDLETVCHKCLEKDPKKRYPAAAALAEDVRRFGAGEPVTARPVGWTERAVRWAWRRPAVAGLLAAVALVGALGLGGILWAYGEAVWQRDRARDAALREADKTEEALKEAEAAKEARDDAKRQTYLAQIGRVEAHLQAKDHVAAAGVLQGMGPEHRSWEYRCLRRLTDGTPLTLRGHTSSVYSVCYSPDGTRLASASSDQTVKVWAAKSGAELLSLRGHASPNNGAVTYSPDGTRLASTSIGIQDGRIQGEVKVWDARSGVELLTLRGHTGGVTAVRYSPDGTRLASASGNPDNTVKVWDARSGAELLSLRGHTNWVVSVSYSPDGTHLASASHDGTVKVWDARNGAELLTLRGHTGVVTAVSYSPDGTRLASASYDNTVKVWDATSGAGLLSLRGHTNWVNAVVYSPDGTRLASAALDKTVKVWDARSGVELFSLRGHFAELTAVSYSPDGTRLASASLDQTVKVWDATSGAELLSLRGHTKYVRAVSYSPEGTRLASASDDWTVKIWDTRSGAEIFTLRGHTGEVSSVSYSPDGTRLASASFGDKTVKIWDAQSGAELLSLRGHISLVFSVSYSPDGTRLASAGGDWNDGEVKVWDAQSGAEILTLRGHTKVVRSVSYSPDGTRLASASDDNTVKVWDARSGAELLTLRGAGGCVCYSPDGTRLASAGGQFDNTIKVWDARSGAELLSLRGHTWQVTAVSYSPDGMRIASASGDNTIKIWDARTGAEHLTLRGHTSWVRAVSYSPDGTRLASAGVEPNKPEEIKVWDARSGGYDPWAEDLERRTILAPAWHAEKLAAARQRGDAFAAEFHRRWLAQGDSLRILAWNRLAAGDDKACQQTLQELHAQQRSLGDLGRPSPVLSVATVGLAAQPAVAPWVGCVVTAMLWEQEQRRVATVLLRAATPVADHGLPAAELVQLGQQAVEAEPQSWRSRELLGAALYRAGRHAEAVRELDEAVRLHGKGPLWARLFLALAHRRLGHAKQAQEYRRQALPASGWEDSVLQAQLLNELDDPLPDILAGRARPTSATHAADLARRCIYFKRLYAGGARLYTEAFAADPRLLEDYASGHRYDAACGAALAAAGQGNDAAALGAPERLRLRRQALDWLRADLEHWTKTLQSGKQEDRNQVLQKMQHWQQDSDLVGVRDRQGLAALPAAERRLWEQLWADVAGLLGRAQQAK